MFFFVSIYLWLLYQVLTTESLKSKISKICFPKISIENYPNATIPTKCIAMNTGIYDKYSNKHNFKRL